MSALIKYLKQYAESESHMLGDFPSGFQQGLIVPAYRETLEDINRLINFAKQQAGSLLVLVLNRPDSDQNDQWARDLLAQELFTAKPHWQSTDKTLRCYSLKKTDNTTNTPSATNNPSSILVVDRIITGAPIPAEQGVGLARKIGADILCRLIHDKKVTSPWLANTDADAILPSNYFNALTDLDNRKKIAAVVFPFAAQLTETLTPLPTLLYDFSLHYYVAGLSWAGSPYNYHTIGSIIAPHYQHYAQVRGFPKRAAAEDFYLLNKLAKTGSVTSLQHPVVKIIARHSDRVPFGTGPAVRKLAAADNPLNMSLYHPDCFLYLKYFLQLQQILCQQECFSADLISYSCKQLPLDKISTIDKNQLLKASEHFKLSAALQHCFQQGATPAARALHLQQWFDGFKTLKFIHWIRDGLVGTVTFSDWLTQHSSDSMPVNQTMKTLIEQIKTSSSLTADNTFTLNN